ncbi:MAG: hypothetical protein KDJ55_10180 [Rhodobiaceae bacterium]|nr:hypothetical protein [Rhodobiaceae bacterium]MCC0012502.1 hypothetical protein [Rhodobiaceae bacterium]MCC0061709.1 hypothetical protein [Rhodobiaceae bacterium]
MVSTLARHVLAIALALAASISLANAQQVSAVAQERDWAIFVGQENGGKVCTVVSQPKVVKPDGLNRGDIYFYVTTRPNEGVRYEVSVKTGYTYYSGSETEVKIGDSVFKLFTNEDWAFTDNAAEEDRLVNAMRAGSSMVVTGKSSRGNTTIDTYSLLGITAALARAAKECS